MNSTDATALARAALTEAGAESSGDQYLSFFLGRERYAVDILRVQEIRGWEGATRIPNTPGYVKGVINLRGTIVPLVDLRLRFGLEQADYLPVTVVIVVTVKADERSRTMGVVVDSVSDVVNLQAGAIRPAPEFGSQVSTEFISGLASAGEELVMVLDLDRLLNCGGLEVGAAA